MTSPVPQSASILDISPEPSRPAQGSASSATPASTATALVTASVTSSVTAPPPSQDASRREPSTAATTTSELARAKISLYDALRRYQDFPIPGISFIDIMPLFRNPTTHSTLLQALTLQAAQRFAPSSSASAAAAAPWVDVVVGLDARGFLFGPGLALSLGAGFAPIRKQGKLPGPCETSSYEKEYGTDFFQIQADAITHGQKVLIVDDIIATGGSAAAAGELVRKLGGHLVGYLFILEISFLKGREKLGNAPVVTLLEEAD